MAYSRRRRSYSRRRPTYSRRRRTYSRRPMAVTIKRRRYRKTFMNPRPIKIKRKLTGAINGPTTAGVAKFGAGVYKLSDIQAAMQFDNMYDNYRIVGINIKLTPPVTAVTVPAQDPGTLYWYHDPDDGITPTDYANFINRPQIKSRRLVGNRPFNIFFRPKPAGYALDGSTPSPATVLSSYEWMDTLYTSVPYYSWKWMWASDNSINQLMSYEVTFYVEFKHLINMNGG